jgi:UDP-N-acetylmuramate dehydrogenase
MNFLENYDFGSLTGYKTKGVVKRYKEVSSKQDLLDTLEYVQNNNVKFVACGGGSNILIKGSFDGIFVSYKDESIQKMSESPTQVLISAGASLDKQKLVEYCYDNGYSGLEFWAGIPGLVGGGVAMNCGAYGSQTQDCVSEVELCSLDKGIHTVFDEDVKWSYRSAGFSRTEVITSCTFRLKKDDPKKVRTLSLEHVKDREFKHPLEYPSCGSVFKNPQGTTKGAWELIKDAGLCGSKVGGAMVSTKHSNFIVNVGGATYSDVIQLIEQIKIKVKQTSGIQLSEELRIY